MYQSDPALLRSMRQFVPNTSADVQAYLDQFGKICGSASMLEHSELAEKNRPTLRQFDSYGRRIDVVDYHPSYHVLMSHALKHGSASYAYNHSESVEGSHVVRAALIYMENQVEAGHCCPVVMTSAAVPVLKKAKLGEFMCNYIYTISYVY